jgi:hypothetical protein
MDRCELITFLNSREPEKVPVRPCCVAALLVYLRKPPPAVCDRLPACVALPVLESVP